MTKIATLLEKRKEIKRRQPTFLAQDVHKKSRIRKRWVRPRGLHSKIRLGKRGYRVRVRPGYGSPSLVKGLVGDKVPKLIHSAADLIGLDAEKHGVIISARVGQRKKSILLQKAKDSKLAVLNINYDNFVKKVDEDMKKRRSRKKSKVVKEEKPKEVKKETKKSEKEDKPEDAAKKEKKEQDKILTQKE
jgi:large subunit ribosomal protein L32e